MSEDKKEILKNGEQIGDYIDYSFLRPNPVKQFGKTEKLQDDDIYKLITETSLDYGENIEILFEGNTIPLEVVSERIGDYYEVRP